MKSSPEALALHFHVGSDADRAMINKVFAMLSRVAGRFVENKHLSKEEIGDRGYDADFVKQVGSGAPIGLSPIFHDQNCACDNENSF